MQFYLVIGPTEEFQGPIRASAPPVAGPVQACARRAAERVGDEPLGRVRGLPDVAAPDLHPADADLAFGVAGDRVAVGVQQVDVHPVAGVADRDPRPARVPAAAPAGHVDPGLGRAVEVVQLGPQAAAEESLLQAHRKGFPADQHLA